jgi:hypothetical protein
LRVKAIVICAASVILLMPSSILAGDYSFGFKAGADLASFYGADALNAEFRVGVYAGGFFVYRLSELFELQPEAFFSIKGNTYEEEGIETTTRLDYIEIPLLARFNLPVEEKYSPVIFAGPYVAFSVGAESRIKTAEEDKVGRLDDVELTDAGMVVGGEISIDLGGKRLLFDLRYSAGLANVFRSGAKAAVGGEDSGGNTGDASVKNRAIVLMAGIRF